LAYRLPTSVMSGLVRSDTSDLWKLGSFGTPDPARPTPKLDNPGPVYTNAIDGPRRTVRAQPKIIGVATAVSATTSVTVLRPGGVTNGVLLVAFIKNTLSGFAPSAPAGWTQHVELNSVTHGISRVFYKIADNEPESFTFTASSGALTAHVISVISYDRTQPFETTPVTQENSAGTTTRFGPPMNLSRSFPLILWYSFGTGTLTAPVGWSLVPNALSNGSHLIKNDRDYETFGGSITAIQTGTAVSMMIGVAIRPALREEFATPSVVQLDSTGASHADMSSVSSRDITTITVGAGDDRVLVVFSGTYGNSAAFTVTGMTWNGVPLLPSFASNNVGLLYIDMWYLPNPAVGNFTLTVTYNAPASGQEIITWASLNNAAIGAFGAMFTTVQFNLSIASNPSITLNPTGSLTGYPLAFMVARDGDGNIDFPTTGGQTRLATGPTAFAVSGALDTETPAASQSLTMQATVAIPYDALMYAFSVQPSSKLAVERAMPPINYIQSRFQHLMVR
jgi:hypothetical protein